MEDVFENLEEVSPWSENFKRLRHEATLMALHHKQGARSLIGKLPADVLHKCM
jgi:hypothetical protein